MQLSQIFEFQIIKKNVLRAIVSRAILFVHFRWIESATASLLLKTVTPPAEINFAAALQG